MAAADVAYIESKLGVHPDFPIKGINFLDIFPILADPIAFEMVSTHFLNHLFTHTIPNTQNKKIDVIVGLDARGFLFGPILASRLGAAFVPVRKAGKLPGKTISVTYKLEYGSDTFEMQEGSIPEGSTVVIIDDLIATGGSAKAAGELVAKSGGKVVENLFVINLEKLGGYAKLDSPSYAIITSQED